MMRSMYSAVSGLKTHQTKMDVIGNNIANVNTIAFKSSSVTFQDMLYQNLSGASGANANTGVGGVNAKQIGLGVTTGATSMNITSAGAAETTGNPFDIRITDSSTTNFFVVNNGSENLFTRSGSFYVDGAGNLAMTSTGYTVMGWQVDPTTGLIRKDTVSPLQIMKTENLTSAAEATTNATCGGIIDKNDSDVKSDDGLIKNLTFYDRLGYEYTARFAIKSTGTAGEFTVELKTILDAEGNTFYDPENPGTGAGAIQPDQLFGTTKVANSNYTLATGYIYTAAAGGTAAFITDANGINYEYDAQNQLWKENTPPAPANPQTLTLTQVYGADADILTKAAAYPGGGIAINAATGALELTYNTVNNSLTFSTDDGTFTQIGDVANAKSVNLNMALFGGQFDNIDVDFSTCKNTNNGGKSTVTMGKGATDGTTGTGKKTGALTGLSVNNNGEIFGTYDNGNRELLGQIAVAQFANASGLEKSGDNCYTTTLNSGEFDGIGVEISADGSKMTSGEIEMSNVDLSTEFTYMITTQRGFQANSRVITTSDTLLEELVNLKR